MNDQEYPTGWDEARVKRVIEHYENLSEEELIAEDEAAEKAGKNQLPVPWAHKGNGVRAPKKRRRAKTKSRVKRRKG